MAVVWRLAWASVCLWDVVSNFLCFACFFPPFFHLLNCPDLDLWVFLLFFFLFSAPILLGGGGSEQVGVWVLGCCLGSTHHILQVHLQSCIPYETHTSLKYTRWQFKIRVLIYPHKHLINQRECKNPAPILANATAKKKKKKVGKGEREREREIILPNQKKATRQPRHVMLSLLPPRGRQEFRNTLGLCVEKDANKTRKYF